jgi:hypothetical protein
MRRVENIVELIWAGLAGALFAYMLISAIIGEPMPMEWLLHPMGG